MGDPWQVLEQAGVPDGAPRRAAAELPAGDRIRAAIAAVTPRLDARAREPLLAWLRALEHHWPSRFEEFAGAEGRRLAAEIEATPIDANKYLKLRRIAIENLASSI